MRKLPPLNAIRAFEAAARHESFTKAAAELFVTHGAVSRQVSGLEDWLGVKLFRRSSSQLHLTEAGKLYQEEVSVVLDRLALASIEVKERASPMALRISAPPTFMMRWLLRRLTSFQRKRPEVDLQLTTGIGPITTNEGRFDVAIRGFSGNTPGWASAPFMTEIIAPIAQTELLKLKPFASISDFKKHTLITYLTEPYSWSDWFGTAGVEPVTGQDTLSFEQMFFALQAMQDGLGIGLFPVFLVIDELVNGQLRLPLGTLGTRQREYRAFYRDDYDNAVVISEFCAWLKETGDQTEQQSNSWIELLDRHSST